MTQCMEGDEAGGWWKVGLLNQLGGAGDQDTRVFVPPLLHCGTRTNHSLWLGLVS